jgi:glycosyltransferase involved in cell wall biosynthesis
MSLTANTRQSDDFTAQSLLPELSVVMPCLNEASSIAGCITQIAHTLAMNNISGEIIVADNGSDDDSREIAAGAGARIVSVAARGYGSALMGGIAAARGKYIIIGDADGSYDFTQIPLFMEKLRSGYELVMGNRFKGGIQPGAMPGSHKYFGNPVLTGIGRLFFETPCHDFHCGLRAFSKDAYERMELRTTGMEFASEMVVKASLFRLRTCEVPTTLSLDKRAGKSHIRSWHDGWGHLRFLLLYSPRWLFFICRLGNGGMAASGAAKSRGRFSRYSYSAVRGGCDFNRVSGRFIFGIHKNLRHNRRAASGGSTNGSCFPDL